MIFPLHVFRYVHHITNTERDTSQVENFGYINTNNTSTLNDMAPFNPETLLQPGVRPLIMGILNVTPDSFYPESRAESREEAVDRALKMVEDGADIIDIGGESSRPGADPVTESREIDRVVPVIESLSSQTDVPISVDTYHAGVARYALEGGASIINDISALRFDEGMGRVITDAGATVVLMHMQGTPRTMQKHPHYDNVVEEVVSFLGERIAHAGTCGIDPSRIIIDPGIGFGKTLEHNLALLRDIDKLHDLRCPILVGASRKSMIGMITGSPVEDRAWGTAAIVAHGVLHGVHIHRVHDVREMRQVCHVAYTLRSV